MDHQFRFTAAKIHKRIELVSDHRFRDAVTLEPFRYRELAEPSLEPDLATNANNWEEVAPGTYWAGADTHFTLRTRFDLPQEWTNPALHLPLGSLGDIFNHPESLLYVDGKILGSADRHHHTIALDGIDPGPHELILHGWTGLAGWPPSVDAPDRLLMRECELVDLNPVMEEFLAISTCALEAADLPSTSVDCQKTDRIAILDALDAAFVALDTRAPLQTELQESAAGALATLKQGLAAANGKSDQQLTAIGHAHMDIAYLWPVAESRSKNARTYSNVLRLMDRHPQFHFTHSQPQLYDYCRTDFPEIYAQIEKQVEAGRWEPIGGMWVEPDTNIPGAEALVRQILLGRRWFQAAFEDSETPILWLPDTFGFSWCLPQLMKLSGLEMLVTNKLSWNQHNRLPSSTCWWQGMDGSKVLLHLLTTPRDVQHLPFPTNYKSDLTAREVRGTITNASQPAIDNLPICFGYGDGGGGPTEELIARAKAYESIPTMPNVRMGRAADFLEQVKSVSAGLPSWQDELYMEGHRGVLTSQGWIKRANRSAEAALHRAELLAVMGGETQQSEGMSDAWKLLCLNQFHDTLSGTAIGKVFAEARLDYQRIDEICDASEALQLDTLGGTLGVLNPSPLTRHSLGLVPHPVPDVTSQQVADGYLVDLPPLVGYGTATLDPTKSETGPLAVEEKDGSILLENAYLRCELGADGTVHAAYCKSSKRDLLAAGERGNQLWAFEDRPISWDAWDIDPFFEDRGEEIVDVTSMQVVESGPLRVAVRVERTYRQSRIVQFIRLTDRSARLEFATQIEWHQQHTLLKAAFPLGVVAKNATYQIQWGHIERSTSRDTRRDASRFEVCGHKWAALHDGAFAVGLINDGKYGHDTHGSTMRLTLIKSSTMPDPNADQGAHEFIYALLPQVGDGYATIRAEAEALNHPVLIAPGLAELRQPVCCNAPNIVIETVKPSEDGRGVIVRAYEAEGRRSEATFLSSLPLDAVEETDLLEKICSQVTLENERFNLAFEPFQIRTLRLIESA